MVCTAAAVGRLALNFDYLMTRVGSEEGRQGQEMSPFSLSGIKGRGEERRG